MSITQRQLEENCIYDIEKNNLEKVKQFLSSGFNINSFFRSNYKLWETSSVSILAIASYFGAETIVEFLLEQNVNINQGDPKLNRTALHWAVMSKNCKITEMLINSGAFVNVLDRESVSPLITATKFDDLNMVKLLIKKGANVNLKDRFRLSALSYACMLAYEEVALELIANGCVFTWNIPLNAYLPLEYLMNRKQYKIVKHLIDAGYCLKKEKWLTNRGYQTKTIDREPLIWLKTYLNNPRSLMNICRTEIRKRLGDVCVNEKISNFNISSNLKDYLKMKF